MKLWGGRFNQETNAIVDDFNASIHFDHLLYEVDIRGSIAHVKMLNACDLIDEAEASSIIDGLVAHTHRTRALAVRPHH